MSVTKGSKDPVIELCGTYSAGRPPIAIHGLATSKFGLPVADTCDNPTSGCAMLTIDMNANTPFLIWGTTYAPNSGFDLDLKKTTKQMFGDGLIVGTLDITGTGNASPVAPAITRQRTLGGSSTVVLLTVQVCPDGGGACKERLKAKVKIADPSGVPVAGKRQVTVLNWSVQR
jgi:hypothetical protein